MARLVHGLRTQFYENICGAACQICERVCEKLVGPNERRENVGESVIGVAASLSQSV